VEGCISRVFVVLVEVGQRLHQLIALRHGKVGVVQGLAALAVRVEPPVALQDCLVEQRALGTQERLHNQAVIGQGTNMEYLMRVEKEVRRIIKCREFRVMSRRLAPLNKTREKT
jgi:hypothetical protein